MIIRCSPKSTKGFTYIDKRLLSDERLSFLSIGVAGSILSMDDDWGFNFDELLKCSSSSRLELTLGIDELIFAGYLIENASSKGGWDFYELSRK